MPRCALLRLARQDRDARAEASELDCHRLAETGAAAGDRDDLAGERAGRQHRRSGGGRLGEWHGADSVTREHAHQLARRRVTKPPRRSVDSSAVPDDDDATEVQPMAGETEETNDAVLLEIDGAVATVSFNRPDRLNAWSWEMGMELHRAHGGGRGEPRRARRDPARQRARLLRRHRSQARRARSHRRALAGREGARLLPSLPRLAPAHALHRGDPAADHRRAARLLPRRRLRDRDARRHPHRRRGNGVRLPRGADRRRDRLRSRHAPRARRSGPRGRSG